MQVLDSLVDGAIAMTNAKERDAYLAALLVYLRTGAEPKLSGNALAMWISNFPVIEKSRARIESGSKGGSKTTSKRQSKTNTKSASDIYSSSSSLNRGSEPDSSTYSKPTDIDSMFDRERERIEKFRRLKEEGKAHG